MNRYACLPCLPCLLLCAATASASTPGWVHVDQIDAPIWPGGSSGARFGTAVAVDLAPGSNQIRALLVGAPRASNTYMGVDYPEAGQVYVFVPKNGGWQVIANLQNAVPQAYAHFGAAVAVNNGVAAVGVPGYTYQTHVGAGYVAQYLDLNRNFLTYQAPAFVPSGAMNSVVDNAHLGAGVAVNGDGLNTGGAGSWVAGGAPGAGAGCAYLRYVADTGTNIDKGNVCGASSGDAFGTSVAVYSFGASQVFMVAGATGENTTTGAAHVFHLSGGNLANLSDLHAQNPGQFDFFGSSVAIDGQRIYVGGTGRDKSGVGRTGSVTLFNPGGANFFTFDTEVFPGSGANPGDLCGVSIYPNPTGSGFAVGCPGSNGQADGEGFARVVEPISIFGGTIWVDQVLQMGSLPHGVDDMGRGVVMVGDHVFAGAPLADVPRGVDNGAVQVFAPDELFADGFGG